jgi:hypothetical protein
MSLKNTGGCTSPVFWQQPMGAAEYGISNVEPQKSGPYFDIRHSLFDILRFKKAAHELIDLNRLQSDFLEEAQPS